VSKHVKRAVEAEDFKSTSLNAATSRSDFDSARVEVIDLEYLSHERMPQSASVTARISRVRRGFSVGVSGMDGPYVGALTGRFGETFVVALADGNAVEVSLDGRCACLSPSEARLLAEHLYQAARTAEARAEKVARS
jgi:hypothetical protein